VHAAGNGQDKGWPHHDSVLGTPFSNNVFEISDLFTPIGVCTAIFQNVHDFLHCVKPIGTTSGDIVQALK
jgi:hypothetical protein